MLFDVVATLGGAVTITLGGAGIDTLGGPTVATLGTGVVAGSAVGWPAMISVRRRIVAMCIIFSCAEVGTVPPSCVRNAWAASTVVSFSERTGTWQWLG